MRIKVQPGSGRGLCHSCREAWIVDFANGRQSVRCMTRGHATEGREMQGTVVRCSDYDNKNTTARWEMDKMAWTVRTDKSGKAIGFSPPKEKDEY